MVLNINGVELHIDLLDADVLEKYEFLIKKIAKDIKEPTQYEGKSNADSMRIQCKLLNDFFDNMFGNGTSIEIFGENSNLGIRLDAFGQVAELSKSSGTKVKKISDKYTGRLSVPNNRNFKSNKNKYRK